MSALRGARIFHPRGIGYAATLRIRSRVPGVRLFDEPGEHPALCRFSRALGLPERVPDILGLALRVPELYGPGRHQDFLLATGAGPPVLRHVLLPNFAGFFGQTLSSLLPYSVGGRVRVVGAESDHARGSGAGGALAELEQAAERGQLTFRLMLAPAAGRWQTMADLHVGRRLPDEQTEKLAFTPWHCGDGIRPVGPFQGLRRPAYRGSQRGRGLAPSDVP